MLPPRQAASARATAATTSAAVMFSTLLLPWELDELKFRLLVALGLVALLTNAQPFGFGDAPALAPYPMLNPGSTSFRTNRVIFVGGVCECILPPFNGFEMVLLLLLFC